MTDNDTMTAMAERFKGDTAGHEMTVLHEDGLYRHLRFRSPDCGFYWFDLITWPGNLTVSGDCGTFTFARDTDMFGFFRGSRVNPQYWAEKVRGETPTKSYSEDRFRQLVFEAFSDAVRHEGAPRGLGKEVHAEILQNPEIHYEDGARQALDDFEFYKDKTDRYDIGKKPDFRFSDTWEWDLSGWDWEFLWCCHAIVWGISQYDKRSAGDSAPAVAASL